MWSLETELLSVPVAQKRTGRAKQFVLMYPDHVIKGPYDPGSGKIKNIKERSRMFQEWKLQFPIFPKHFFEHNGYEFVMYPTFEPDRTIGELHKESFSDFQYHLAKDLKTLSLKESLIANVFPLHLIEQLIYELVLFHLLSVGDVGHRNIRIDPKQGMIWLIDYDENCSNDRDDPEFYFSKRSAKESGWLALALPHYPAVKKRLAELEVSEQLRARKERILNLLDDRSEKIYYHGPFNKKNHTRSGFPLDVAKSALQKFIRRGEVELSLGIAHELYEFHEIAPAVVTNLFNRLAIIAAEDVGPADLRSIRAISVASEKKNLNDIVYTLAQAKKTRLMSHIYRVYCVPEGSISGKQRLLLIDQIGEGDDPLMMFRIRLAERDYNAFYWAFYFLEHVKDAIPRTKKYHKGAGYTTKPAILIWLVLKTHLEEETYDVLVKAFFDHTENRPFLSFAILLALCRIKDPISDLLGCDMTIKQSMTSLPEYVYDKHTSVGRANGKGRREFVTEGALIFNPDPRFQIKLFEEIYLE